MNNAATIQRALISVSDKTGLVDFARELVDTYGIEILSTGGTARALAAAGIAVTQVSDHTGEPEIMDGRVKTLHPKIHGGILARRGQDDTVLAEQNIQPIDLVVVNLYPFEKTIAKPDCSFADAIENIDIGGPTMLRAAAKNHAFVTLVVDTQDYATVLKELAEYQGSVSADLRQKLATKGFAHTAHYDRAITDYLTAQANEQADEQNDSQQATLPQTLELNYQQHSTLRYGENPHQQAAVYTLNGQAAGGLVNATQHQGKALSYNNLADADAALACVSAFATSTPACVIVKHANPCGVATAATSQQAYERAFATDPVSAFGGILAFNTALDAATASAIVNNQFAEVIIAPAVADDALAVFAAKKNLRVLTTPLVEPKDSATTFKPIAGGLLVQENDHLLIDEQQLKVVTKVQPTEAQMADLLFAWRVAKYVKSNAIVYAHAGQTLGIGAGQMSRVDSARIGHQKADDAGLSIAGAAMASDAFFPFRDGVDTAAKAGVKAVIQPGGSILDGKVIKAADEAGMAMVLTGMRHFRH